MAEEELLRRLGQMAKEEAEESHARFDERWDRLSTGTLEPEEKEALRELAESSSEAREAYEAFRPVDSNFKARLLTAVQEEQRSTAPARAPGKLLSFPTTLRSTRTLAVAAAALAAVFAMFLLRPSDDDFAPLPEYALSLEGGLQSLRGESDQPIPVFTSGSQFELVLRPATAVSGPVDAKLFLQRDQDLRAWNVATESSANGSLRLKGEISTDISIEPGSWTLWAVIGRPSDLPERIEPESLDEGPWILLRARFRVDAEP